MFLTVDPGGAADLRDLYVYYVGSRTKLAGRPRVASRPDLGPGAFTLTLDHRAGRDGVLPGREERSVTLSVDLVDAGAGSAIRRPSTGPRARAQPAALAHPGLRQLA